MLPLSCVCLWNHMGLLRKATHASHVANRGEDGFHPPWWKCCSASLGVGTALSHADPYTWWLLLSLPPSRSWVLWPAPLLPARCGNDLKKVLEPPVLLHAVKVRLNVLAALSGTHQDWGEGFGGMGLPIVKPFVKLSLDRRRGCWYQSNYNDINKFNKLLCHKIQSLCDGTRKGICGVASCINQMPRYKITLNT